MMSRSIMAGMALVLLAGCFTSREIVSLQREISSNNPSVELRRNVVFSVGPGTMHLLERAAGLWESEETLMASQYLSDIDRVKVGVYDVHSRFDGADDQAPRYVLPSRDGWIPFVVVRDEHNATTIHYRETGRAIRDLLVVTASSDKLVIVRLQGNLGRILLRALEDRERFVGRSTMMGIDVEEF
jgi:hypothetical protein